MYKKIIEFIETEELIQKNDKLLIAFSGGPDSVALARLLMDIRKDYKLELGLCHINHNLRGKESDEDEEFCREFSKKHNLEFFSLKADIVAYGKNNKLGLEEAGREIRYEFLEKTAGNNFYNKIALAHNLDDNVETFLFRLMRGTGLEGLKGIPVKRDNIIRPLLFMKKAEILSYLEEIKQEFRIDSSNNENIYTRNKIRLELIPYIEKEFNPRFKDNINSLIESVNDIKQNDLIFSNLEEFFKYSKEKQKSILYKMLKEKKLEISRGKIDEILKVIEKDGYKEVSLGNNFILKKTYNSIEIIENKIEMENKEKEKIELDIPSKIGYNGYNIEIKLVEEIEKNKNYFYFDYEKLSFPIFVRTKEEGDKFLSKGMASPKKLKKFFIDEKIDKDLRDRLPIILANNDILLVSNLRKSSIGELDSKSNKILLIKVEEGVFSEQQKLK